MNQPIPKLGSTRPAAPATEADRPVRYVVAAMILRQAPNQAPNQAASQAAARTPDQPAPSPTGIEVLICQRKPDQPMSLKWEFPGGKIEPGENPRQALARELEEELGIQAAIGRSVAQIRHKYRNGGTIDLQFFVVETFTGTLENRIFNDMRWVALKDLPTFDFLAADLGLIRDLAEGRLL